MDKAKITSFLGKLPFIGSSLRKIARRYQEGSVVTIKNGHLAGYKWKRSHRYVNGYWLGIYELPTQECLIRELKSEDIFYDIGANAGFFSLLGAKCVGQRGHVFSFEPLPENIESIKDQFKLNEVRNCTLVEAAVSNSVGDIEFCKGKDTSTGHIGHKKNDEETSNVSTVVRTITLDEFVKSEHPPDFIKMDIEGAEIMALQKATEILGSASPPKLIIELHNEDLKKQGQSLLSKFGYSFFTFDGKMIKSGYLPHYVLAVPASKMPAKQ